MAKKDCSFPQLMFDVWKANGKSLRSHRYQDLLSMNAGKSDSVLTCWCTRQPWETHASLPNFKGRLVVQILLGKFHRVDCSVGSFEPNILLSWCHVCLLTVVESGDLELTFWKVFLRLPFCLVQSMDEVGATFEFESKVMVFNINLKLNQHLKTFIAPHSKLGSPTWMLPVYKLPSKLYFRIALSSSTRSMSGPLSCQTSRDLSNHLVASRPPSGGWINRRDQGPSRLECLWQRSRKSIRWWRFCLCFFFDSGLWLW